MLISRNWRPLRRKGRNSIQQYGQPGRQYPSTTGWVVCGSVIVLSSCLTVLGLGPASVHSDITQPVVATFVSDAAVVRAGLIATQILGLALCRYVLRLAPVVDMSRDDIVNRVGPTIQRYFDAPMSAPW
jgi:hypothetical protein